MLKGQLNCINPLTKQSIPLIFITKQLNKHKITIPLQKKKRRPPTKRTNARRPTNQQCHRTTFRDALNDNYHKTYNIVKQCFTDFPIKDIKKITLSMSVTVLS